MPVHLRDPVRTAGIERGRLALGGLSDLAEHLAGAGLVETSARVRDAERFEHTDHAHRVELCGEDGLLPRRRHEGLRRQVVDLVGAHIAHEVDQRELVEQIGVPELDAIADVRDALEVLGARASYHADDAVPLFEEKLGEIGTVLPRDPRDDGATLHHGAPTSRGMGGRYQKAYWRARPRGALVGRRGPRYQRGST